MHHRLCQSTCPYFCLTNIMPDLRESRRNMEVHLPAAVLHPLVAAMAIISISSFATITLAASLPCPCSESDLLLLEEMQSSFKLTMARRDENNCCIWQGIVCNSHGHVVSVNLSSSGMAGPISLQLFNLTYLQILDLSNNSLSGPLPIAMANLARIIYINLSHNPLLSAPFPSSLPSSLRYLDLSHCSMQGALAQSSLANASSLEELFISNNFFSSLVLGGVVPAGSVTPSSLQVFDASSNLLEGPLPAYLDRMRCIQKLRLARNNLTGPIPKTIGNCKQLTHIMLDGNRLSGFIPKAVSQLVFLTDLSLANNKLAGPIPVAIAQCTSLVYLSLSENSLSGYAPAAIAALPNLQVLHLDKVNQLRDMPHQWKQVGTIPHLTYRRITSLQIEAEHPKQAAQHYFSASVTGKWPWKIGRFFRILDALQDNSAENILHLVLTSVRATFSPKSSVLLTPPQAKQSSPCLNSDVCEESIHPRRKLKEETSEKLKPVIIGVTSGAGLFCVVAFVLVLVYMCRRRSRKNASDIIRPKEVRTSSQSQISKVFDPSLKSISMGDLSMATDHFHDSRIVGDGGFGLVYSGILPDRRHVAIKRLASDGMQGKREFEAEMETIGKIKHPNLVELLAYCKVGEDRLLVYEFVHNGSLSSWLHEKTDGPKILDWKKRIRIAQGGAKGLSYLHDECSPRILHRDIKSSNILLTNDFEPKIADFGLARFISPMVSHVSTDVAGTLGYMAPEYSLSLGATKQADVYSFGVVLLELATGKRPDMVMQEKGARTLAKWATSMVQQEREMELLDPALMNSYHLDQIYTYFHISCSCVHENPSERPTMKKVFELLSLIQ